MTKKKRSRRALLILLVLVLAGGIYYRRQLVDWASSFITNVISPAQRTAPSTPRGTSTSRALVSTTPVVTTTAIIVTSTPTSSPLILTFSASKLAGTNSPLLPFGASDFKRALDAHKLIVLYFYSNSTTSSIEEYPEIIDAFNQLSTDKIVGFKINVNDDITEAELRVTRDYNVATSNTKIFLKYNQEVLRSSESWDQQEYLNQFTKILTTL